MALSHGLSRLNTLLEQQRRLLAALYQSDAIDPILATSIEIQIENTEHVIFEVQEALAEIKSNPHTHPLGEKFVPFNLVG